MLPIRVDLKFPFSFTFRLIVVFGNALGIIFSITFKIQKTSKIEPSKYHALQLSSKYHPPENFYGSNHMMSKFIWIENKITHHAKTIKLIVTLRNLNNNKYYINFEMLKNIEFCRFRLGWIQQNTNLYNLRFIAISSSIKNNIKKPYDKLINYTMSLMRSITIVLS